MSANALLDKMLAEQAAGWPTPPTWGPGDVYPDPLLAQYVTLIRRTITAVSRANTRANGRMSVHTSDGRALAGRPSDRKPQGGPR